MVEPDHPGLSVRRQCELLGLYRSSLYYEPLGVSAENLALMRLIDEQYLKRPFTAGEEMAKRSGHRPQAGQRLMRRMGLEAIYPKPQLCSGTPGHRIYPYLLRNVEIERPDQVWTSDITYVPHAAGLHVPDGDHGLVQSLRPVLAAVEHVGRLFCLDVLEEALGGASRKSSTPTRACSTRPRR